MALKVAKILGVVVLVYGMIWAEVFSRSKEQYRKAEAAYAQGDVESATLHYSRALRMYGPGIPYNRKSIDQLLTIAQQHESRREFENALNAYEELAAAVRVIRSFYYPYHQIELQARAKMQELEPTVIQIQADRRQKEEEEWRASQATAPSAVPPTPQPAPVPTP